jgi:hypothetical protein
MKRASQAMVQIANQLTTLVNANPNRVGLIIVPDANNSFNIGLTSDITQNTGLIIESSAKPYEICGCHWGDYSTRQIFAHGSSSFMVAIVEIIEDGQ